MKRTVICNKLAYFQQEATSQLWGQRWQNKIQPNYYKSATRGNLGHFQKVFKKYLPQNGPILEAGCGLGRYVIALNACGYACEGIDYSENTINLIKSIHPKTPVRVGDVTNIEVPTGYYKGYISIGVIEHRKEGPEPFLAEAYRVLSDDGIAFFCVPFFHMLRRVKAVLGFYNDDISNEQFYQFAFSRSELEKILNQHGFKVISTNYFSVGKGLTDELLLFRMLFRMGKIGYIFKIFISNIPYCKRLFGHMIGMICRKEKINTFSGIKS